MASEAKLTIYGRSYCHLCDEMVDALQRWCADRGLRTDVEMIDVDADAALEERFGDRVPVLVGNGVELCHFHLDPAAVAAYFAEVG